MTDTLFDYLEGERRALEGMFAASLNAGPTWTAAAHEAVRAVARLRVTFTADDVWDYLFHHHLPEPPNRAALGAVFKGLSRAGIIRQTGEWRNSQRPETHTRPLRVWQAV